MRLTTTWGSWGRGAARLAMLAVLISPALVSAQTSSSSESVVSFSSSSPASTSTSGTESGVAQVSTIMDTSSPLSSTTSSDSGVAPTSTNNSTTLSTTSSTPAGIIPFDPFSNNTFVNGSEVSITDGPVAQDAPQATGIVTVTNENNPVGTNPQSAAATVRLPYEDSVYVDSRTVVNYTLPAFSPMIAFNPPNPSTVDEGWNLTYSNVSWEHWDNNSLGLGQALQTTSLSNATMNIFFVGSAIYFTGVVDGSITITATNQLMSSSSSNSVTLNVLGDGTVDGTDSMVLLGRNDIPGQYNVTLTVESGTFTFQSVVITAPLGGLGARATIKTMPLVTNNLTISKDVTPIGEWGTSTGFCGNRWNGSSVQNECLSENDQYDCVVTHSENARLQIPAPANTSVFTIYGTVGGTSGPFQVGTEQYPWDPNAVVYNSGSSWLKSNVPLFTGVLDPRETNTINLDFVGKDSSLQLQAYQVVFYLAVGGYTDYNYLPVTWESNRKPIGKIVGGAVGGGVGFLLIVGCLLCFCLRRRRRQRRASLVSEKTISAKAVGQPLSNGSDSVSAFDAPASATGHSTGTSITPPPAARRSPHQEISTSELVDRKMREARARSQLVEPPQHVDTSTLLSPTANDTFRGMPFRDAPTDPETLPPLKLSLMTESLATTSGLPRRSHETDTPSSAGGHSNLSSSPFSHFPPSFPGGPSSKIRHPLPPVPQAAVTEEEDAGRLPAAVAETVPPRYNPAWADDYVATGRVADPSAGALLASGPSVLAERQSIDGLGGSHTHLSDPTSISPTDSSPASTRGLVHSGPLPDHFGSSRDRSL